MCCLPPRGTCVVPSSTCNLLGYEPNILAADIDHVTILHIVKNGVSLKSKPPQLHPKCNSSLSNENFTLDLSEAHPNS